MLKKYISKFVMDIFPSVIATIIGAYIVNHYIVTKPAAETPVTAAASTVDPNKADPKATDPRATDPKAAKSDAKGSETPSDMATAPDPAPAKKSTADKSSVEKSQEKSADKPTETASLPVDTRRHPPTPHDKSVAKSVPAAAETPAPAVAAVGTVAPAETNPPQEERRDANDLARAAIERLRGASEASRAPAVPRVQEQAHVAPIPVPPLPPAIVVATPPGEGYNPGTTGSVRPLYPPVARVDDPLRPTPPADIPTASRPMELHAETAASVPEHKNVVTVAEDVLSAAKSVFHAVLPH
jgi:hypothetical protein